MNRNKRTAGETAMQTFTFSPSNDTVRVETIGGEPWFVAKDVCDALALTEVSNTLGRLDEDEKLTRTLFVSGQGRQMWLVSESGLYNLIFQSRKAEAKAFRKWVTGEVLPTLRRTGRYEVTGRGLGQLPPRERSARLGAFYRELERWTLKRDCRELAGEYGCTVDHVKRILRGDRLSVELLEKIVTRAKENRALGIKGDLMSPQKRVNQLVMDFMEEGGER